MKYGGIERYILNDIDKTIHNIKIYNFLSRFSINRNLFCLQISNGAITKTFAQSGQIRTRVRINIFLL